MSKVCPRCSSRNPAEARFCHFDGTSLPGTEQSGPLHAATIPFGHPFVFANGQVCQNFNQLVIGCQRNWDLAREVLVNGTLERFLQGLGRADLAANARQAAQSPDADRGLDQLLAGLPADVLQTPRLMVEPTRVNLGHMRAGGEAGFDLLISNLGMRLLYGAVAADCDWLVLGEGPGHNQRIFQTTHELHLPVKVKGEKIRAGAKALTGRLFIDSNAGAQTVEVQVDVPVVPFPTGILAGATTPREVAQKAKKQPKEAAALFEQGAVGDWYRSNGWTYPVEGPSGSGLGAVQQFFEALGLTKAPRVEISHERLQLKGAPGDRIAASVRVTTPEKRPVFAHASSGQAWVRCNAPKFQGALVELPIEVIVPPHPGQTMQGSITVRANGNQRFQVPVTVSIDGMPELVAVTAADAPVVPLPAAREAVKPKKPPAAATAQVGTFGMGRLVYWTSIIGGWSAFVGWLIAELTFGRWVADSFILAVLMVVIVATALSAGLSQSEALLTGQWRAQLRHLGAGLLGGFLGGLLGGLLANLLYFLVGQRIAFVGFLGRVLGWTLLGLTIGICEGILERHWRKFRNGLIGGTLGGFLGGLLFNPVNWLMGSPVSSRAFAFVLLGLCIGLFLSLVHVLLKEAWLTVEEGFRPGRQLILSRRVTTMGTSEKAGLIFIAYGAKGVEPIHLRIFQEKDGSYTLEDNESRGGTLLNDEPVRRPERLENGDLIQLGINKVRFNERMKAREPTS